MARKQGGFFRTLRILILLVILAAVGGEAYLSKLRTTDWDDSLWVSVYPINVDGSDRVAQYIDQLQDEDFLPVEDFFIEEAERFALNEDRPMIVRLAPTVRELPPEPPPGGERLAIALWSLRLRYWAWSMQREYGGPPANITLFVKYYDPAKVDSLPHSLGLQKGLLGVVNAFASRKYRGRNQVVMAHELLHTVGASDKYDMETAQPAFPDGYAEPDRSPRYPQRFAEIMGGRIPLSNNSARMPSGLNYTLIGYATAQEIGWVK